MYQCLWSDLGFYSANRRGIPELDGCVILEGHSYPHWPLRNALTSQPLELSFMAPTQLTIVIFSLLLCAGFCFGQTARKPARCLLPQAMSPIHVNFSVACRGYMWK